ncbi:hypothetical protein PRIPAC_91953, partial [Pristionchus pacificus]
NSTRSHNLKTTIFIEEYFATVAASVRTPRCSLEISLQLQQPQQQSSYYHGTCPTAIRMARNGLTQLHQHFVVSSRSPPRPPPIPIPYNNFLDDDFGSLRPFLISYRIFFTVPLSSIDDLFAPQHLPHPG